MLRLSLAFLPLACALLLAWMLKVDILGVGAGEKDFLIAIPLFVWSLLYLYFFLDICKKQSNGRAAALAAAYASGAIFLIWLVILAPMLFR